LISTTPVVVQANVNKPTPLSIMAVMPHIRGGNRD
jgi:hypothetical protein